MKFQVIMTRKVEKAVVVDATSEAEATTIGLRMFDDSVVSGSRTTVIHAYQAAEEEED